MLHTKQAQRGGRGIALPILEPGAKGHCHTLAALSPGKALLPIVKEAGWFLGQVWMGSNPQPCSLWQVAISYCCPGHL